MLTGHGYVQYNEGSHGNVCLVIGRMLGAETRNKKQSYTCCFVHTGKTGHGHVHSAVTWSQG